MTTASPDILREVAKRRTFAIISHPDAGKTTMTEKLLLFGNAIQMAGMVKDKRAKHYTTSDWMEIEKQRGISVTSSVMQFSYGGASINLLDTPGHADFSEDTYRVLTAVDSALMILDSAKGIETQTKKLFQVCRDRSVPIMTFMNKFDRPSRDPFELIHEVETVLQLPCTIMTWPIGEGDRFKGVYDLHEKCIRLFEPGRRTADFEQIVIKDLTDPALEARIGSEFLEKLREDLELLEAGNAFDHAAYLRGEISPVFFGSALNNFGVQELLNAFVKSAPPPRPRPADTRLVDPSEDNLTGVIFKIQANMDPKHRDRYAFLRICSGVYEPGMTVYHARSQRTFKINNALRFMAQDRESVEQAVAGDIIGLYDRGTLIIGDTITEGEDLRFTGIPMFSPEYFCRVELKNPIKMKQLQKGLDQLAEEGTSQVFRRKTTSDTFIGVVGRLQFEVVQFRLLNEYGAEAIFTALPYSGSRWYRAPDEKTREKFEDYYSDRVMIDARTYPMILFKDEWEMKYVAEKNPDIKFYSSLIAYEQG